MATVTKKTEQAQRVAKGGRMITEDDAAAMAAAFEGDDQDLVTAEPRPVGRPPLSTRPAGGPSRA